MRAPLRLDAAVWLLLCSLSVLWGGSFLFAKIAVAEVGPATLVALRVGIAAAALLLVLRIRTMAIPPLRSLGPAFLVMGLLNNVIPFGLIFWAQVRIDVGLAAILNASTPLWAIVVAHYWTRDEPLTRHKLAGVGVGFAGVVLLVGPGALRGLGESVLAEIAVLVGALSYALAGVWGRRFRGLDPMLPAAGQLTASTLIAAPLAFALEGPFALGSLSGQVIAAILGLALASTALGYVLYFGILARAGAGNALLVTMLIPPSAMLLGALVLDERPTTLSLSGLGLIVIGLALVDGRILRRG
jgi:drug/metabolite transporter (DMT)-like permease